MFDSTGWTLLTIGGPIVIAIVLIYALTHKRRLTHREKAEQHHAIEEIYHDTQADRARREADERGEFETGEPRR